MSLFDRLTAIREAWAVTFGTTPPPDDTLYRWLGIAPQEIIERAFIKCAGWLRAQKVTPTQRQLEKRIKNTLFWLQTTNGVATSTSKVKPRSWGGWRGRNKWIDTI
jgi:hypothetical protein